MQLEQKQKFTKNRGCLPKCKKVFFWYVLFLLFGGFFLLPVFWFLCFVKKAQKGYFPAILEVFCLFCSHTCLKVFLFFLFCFFAFVFPFKTPFYPFAFWPSAPFWKTLIFWFLSFSFSCFFLS